MKTNLLVRNIARFTLLGLVLGLISGCSGSSENPNKDFLNISDKINSLNLPPPASEGVNERNKIKVQRNKKSHRSDNILTGRRGGNYYINRNGNKTYVRKGRK